MGRNNAAGDTGLIRGDPTLATEAATSSEAIDASENLIVGARRETKEEGRYGSGGTENPM